MFVNGSGESVCEAIGAPPDVTSSDVKVDTWIVALPRMLPTLDLSLE
jgi:hypothetical protein